MRIIEKIRKIVNENPNRIAYKIDNDSITYSKLWEISNFYAELLNKQGTSSVIIYANKSVDFIILILACIIANRTYIPIGKCTPIDRLKQIIKITKSSLLNEVDFNVNSLNSGLTVPSFAVIFIVVLLKL